MVQKYKIKKEEEKVLKRNRVRKCVLGDGGGGGGGGGGALDGGESRLFGSTALEIAWTAMYSTRYSG